MFKFFKLFKEKDTDSKRRFCSYFNIFDSLRSYWKNLILIMNRNKNKTLQRMIIISPELFEDLRPFINLDTNLDILDREMLNILKDTKLNSNEKWYRYRQTLARSAEKKRKSYSFPNKEKNMKSLNHKEELKPSKQDAFVQTKYLIKKDNSTTMTPKKILDDQLPNDPSKEKSIAISPEEYFEVDTEESDEDANLIENSNKFRNEELSDDYKSYAHPQDNKESDLEDLIPVEEFDILPRDVHNAFLKKASEYLRNSSDVKDIPDVIGITGEDSSVYHIDTDRIKKRFLLQEVKLNKTLPNVKKSKNKISPKKRVRKYLSRSTKTDQTQLNFPTRKFLNSPKIKWDTIK